MSVDTFGSEDLQDGAGSVDEANPWPAEMCKTLIESSPWPMFVLDCESRHVVEANDAAVLKYQMSRAELIARGVDEVIPPRRRIELNLLLDAGLAAPPRDFYSEHILPDKTLLPVEVRSFALLWNERPSRFFMIRDLTPKPAGGRETELASKLDQAGRVSASAAHDFNNLLTVILAVAEQLQEGEGDPEQQVGLIAKTVRSAQEMAKQRLSLGGQQSAQRERLNLNIVLGEEAEMLRGLLGKQIDLELDFDHELWTVFGDADQWREVVLNLALNARDAMSTGGRLLIATRSTLLSADDEEMGVPRGRYVQLAVQDTGHGMTEETRAQAFKPYFSTKSRTRNSGLGLASVFAVVHQSGGGIKLTSAPGKGTRFDIFIPALPAQEEAPGTPPTGVVLLVEDSDELRRMIQDFLMARGYEVIACGTAEAALKWVRSQERRLDLIIADMILPDLTGDVLVEKLSAERPEAKVVFMSGNPQPDLKHENESGKQRAICLEKPFSLHRLEVAISETLKNASPAGS